MVDDSKRGFEKGGRSKRVGGVITKRKCSQCFSSVGHFDVQL